jgi:Flp pilus assembly pilin Flp
MQRLASDSGATMVEYGFVVSLIALVTILLVQTLGGIVLGWFEAIGNAF